MEKTPYPLCPVDCRTCIIDCFLDGYKEYVSLKQSNKGTIKRLQVFIKEYAYALYLGVAFSICGLHINDWRSWVIVVPTILLVGWRGSRDVIKVTVKRRRKIG